ncbi:Protein trichome birefringence-like 8 [Linum perenne]
MIRREVVYASSSVFFLFIVVVFSSLYAFDLLSPFDPVYYFRVGFLPPSPPAKRVCRQYSDGEWVRSYFKKASSYRESCPFLDPGFRCRRNGRVDVDYLDWRWQPRGCDLPRFNATDLLERARNGRIVFAGDSIGRNQWESLLCMLAQGVSNISTIYEVNGNPITKHRGFLVMRFSDYNLTVEYYRLPFLVFFGRPQVGSPPEVKMGIQVDQLHWFSKSWVGADVIVFNTGHWWNEYKTTNIFLLEFIRNGTWNGGGRCDLDFQPETNPKLLEPESKTNRPVSEVITQMRRTNKKVQYLNITHLTEYRFDGHPSRYREPGTPPDAPQDCSHWCLPGVPDVWNEILYAHLVSIGFRTK